MIIEPTGRVIDLAFDRNLDLKTVPVHPSALVAFRRFRQRLGGFELKIFCQPDAHSGTWHFSHALSSRPAQTARDLSVAKLVTQPKCIGHSDVNAVLSRKRFRRLPGPRRAAPTSG